jgi:Zn ribbon nucleic-acid-binding protein
MVKCPFCGSEGGFDKLKSWKFRFYDVKLLQCSRCGRKFNHYSGVSSKNKRSEFVIRIGQKLRRKVAKISE